MSTVILSGQGADEILAGYSGFVLPYALDRMDPHCRRASRGTGCRSNCCSSPSVSTGIHRLLPRLLTSRVRRRAMALARRWTPPPFGVFPLARHGDIAHRAAREQRFIGAWGARGQDRPYRSHLNNALWTELRYAGLPEALHSEDALSMAFSLESRLPFLDHRVVEFCFSLPYSAKIGNGWTKLLLRRAAADVLPESVLWRRHKQGFPGDYARWLGTDAGLDAVRALLLDPVTTRRGWLDARWLRRRVGSGRTQAARWVRAHIFQVWHVMTLELWCRQFLDGAP